MYIDIYAHIRSLTTSFLAFIMLLFSRYVKCLLGFTQSVSNLRGSKKLIGKTLKINPPSLHQTQQQQYMIVLMMLCIYVCFLMLFLCFVVCASSTILYKLLLLVSIAANEIWMTAGFKSIRLVDILLSTKPLLTLSHLPVVSHYFFNETQIYSFSFRTRPIA